MRSISRRHPRLDRGSRNKKQIKSIFLLSFFWIPVFAGVTAWLIFPSATLAVGISVSPPELELIGFVNKKITGSFTVTNPSRETVIYEITNDGLLSLAITPTTFLLEPNKSANVTVEYNAQSTGKALPYPSHSETILSVLGRPLTVQPTQAASGIKLPVSISVGQVAGASTRRFDPMMIGIVAFDVLLLCWLAYLFIQKLHTRPQSSPRA